MMVLLNKTVNLALDTSSMGAGNSNKSNDTIFYVDVILAFIIMANMHGLVQIYKNKTVQVFGITITYYNLARKTKRKTKRKCTFIILIFKVKVSLDLV